MLSYGVRETSTRPSKFFVLSWNFVNFFHELLLSHPFSLFLRVDVPFHFAEKSLYSAAKIYMLKRESKAELGCTTFIIYCLNSGAVLLTTIAWFILTIGNY